MNIYETLLKNEVKYKARDYIYEKKDGKFLPISYSGFLEKTRKIAHYLLEKGKKGEKIIIFSNNSIDLMAIDLAIACYVGVSIIVSKEWKEDDLKEAITFLDVSCVIYSNSKETIIKNLKQENLTVDYISIEDDLNNINSQTNKDLPQKGNDECVKIVFSSGTTGYPKAVMLSFKNIFAGLPSLKRRVILTEEDSTYLFLPLNHTYGCIYNFYYSLVIGYKIYLASSIQKLGEELQETNPTIFCAVPVIYRTFYEKSKHLLGQAFGKNIKYLFCGGAKLDKEILRTYKEQNLTILEAYALSETASSLSIDYANDKEEESVGTIFEDIEVKIANEDESGYGEIIVKGDNVFLGYANNQTLTNQVMKDGYFYTGDIGYIKDNKIYLIGRKKEILIGENGENISKEKLEEKIKRKDSNINKVKVYWKNNKLSCTIYLKEKENKNWDHFIENLNKSLPKYENIKTYNVVMDSVEQRLKQ